jgi:hypothetical protein
MCYFRRFTNKPTGTNMQTMIRFTEIALKTDDAKHVAVVITGNNLGNRFNASFQSYIVYHNGTTAMQQERSYSNEVDAIKVFDDYVEASK